jgi:hypothetical protein
MQAAPALAFDADDGGVGRVLAALLAALAAAAAARWLVTWLALPFDALDTAWRPDRLLGLASGAAAAVWTWRHARPVAVRMVWDTRRWLWTAPAAGAAPVAGRLRVAIDLGGWMLLAFDPDPDLGDQVGDAATERRGKLPRLRWRASRRWLTVGRVAGGAVRAALYAAAPSPQAPA